MSSWKDNVSFILISPREGGNVGAAARALKNLGFRKLELVAPGDFPSGEARWFAHGALDVLSAVVVHPGFDEAVADKALIAGTTRRVGRQRGPIYTIKEGAKRVREAARKNPVAVVFGREDRGLTNREAAECAFLMNIPADPGNPSYNLSQAVLLAAYEISFAGVKAGEALELATRAELSLLFKRMERALKMLEYLPRGEKEMEKKIFKNIRHLIMRAGLTEWELKMLHGIITRVEAKLRVS